MNKVGGFLQRIDYARKYAFGAMCILKDDKGQFPIRGAWIFRGQAIPPMMVEVRYVFYMLFCGGARVRQAARGIVF
jgi:Elongation factor 1 gamma, conserved domain